MNILILGSEGFIGKAAVKFFKRSYQVFGADLLEAPSQDYKYFKISRLSPEFESILQANPFHACINVAGSGNVNFSMTHPVIDFESNCLDVIRILDGLRRYQPQCKYLHVSSAAIYGNPDELPVSEQQAARPISPYGFHKLISEHICREYTLIYKVPASIVRPFSVFGPGLQKQLFWDIYQKCKVSNGTITLSGDGSESRDFIYIDDLVAAFDCVLARSSFAGEVVNVANGREIKVKEAAQLFVSEFRPEIKVVFDLNARPGDPQNWRGDISLLQRLGYAQSVSMELGIKKLVEWLRLLS